MAMRNVGCREPSDTVNVRSANELSSDGLSIRYCRFGAVKVCASAPGNSCVPTRQLEPAGGSKRTFTGRVSIPRAHIRAAGMLTCAWVGSMERYVPSVRSPNTRYVTRTVEG